jgi:diguanylate cyclase (GGDEF)-like protein/PAS domain S-box-containing protein
MPGWTARVFGSLRTALPEGGHLSHADRQQRHTAILWLLWLHAPFLSVFAFVAGNTPQHSLLEAATLMPWAVAATSSRLPYRVRSVAACLGLVTASAMLVHLMNGAIEAHFHFFVMVSVIALYQDWLPFLFAIGFVVFEHGIGGIILPGAVYNHGDAISNPWKWALIHAVFVLGASAANIAHWRLSELHQAKRMRTEAVLRESQRVLSTLMSNLPGMAYRCANDHKWSTEFVSEGCLELTGYSPEDLVGGGVSFVDIIHPDDRGWLWEDTQRAVAEGRAYQQEYRIVTADGWERWVWEQGRAVVDASGKVVALEGFVSDVTERHQASLALTRQAQHDPLTDLPNRTLLRHELQEAVRARRDSQGSVALLMMDLDRFKEVNDTFGHRYGDELLQQVGQRLMATVGDAGTLARLGGDEFGVLLPGADAATAEAMALRLVDVLEAPLPIEGHSVALGASVGIALFPEHGGDSEILLRHADVAMYVAKRSGGGYAVYSAEQDQHSAERIALAGELRQAIEGGQLVLYYQPTVDCARRRVSGVEALVRWQHPQRGLIPPDSFIPLAEQSGAIKALTTYVLEAALRQCRAWQANGIELNMSVNLSMRNLHDPQLPETIRRLLAKHEVRPERLNLEITESTIMADPTRALNVLQELRALGVHIAIDDFGTGYSSMAYLKGLAVDALKIDKSFVQKLATDASDRAIVRSTVELGHNLGLRVVAEGVEDTMSYEQLARLGCDLAQGFYLGRPMPADQLDRWLADAPFGLGTREQAA